MPQHGLGHVEEGPGHEQIHTIALVVLVQRRRTPQALLHCHRGPVAIPEQRQALQQGSIVEACPGQALHLPSRG
eukprot:922380-Alexandrium_andersonii.AAC.1